MGQVVTWGQGQQVRPENKTIKTDNSSTPLSPLLIGMHTHPHTEAHIHSSISTTLTNQIEPMMSQNSTSPSYNHNS